MGKVGTNSTSHPFTVQTHTHCVQSRNKDTGVWGPGREGDPGYLGKRGVPGEQGLGTGETSNSSSRPPHFQAL